jgi:hypothetical protein
VPALVKREHVEAAGQRRRDKIPPSRVRGAAMHQKHRRTALAPIVDTIELDIGAF